MSRSAVFLSLFALWMAVSAVQAGVLCITGDDPASLTVIRDKTSGEQADDSNGDGEKPDPEPDCD